MPSKFEKVVNYRLCITLMWMMQKVKEMSKVVVVSQKDELFKTECSNQEYQ
jgi:hypothetical protein